MANQRCYADVGVKNGPHYTVLETVEDVMAALESGSSFVGLTCWTGSELMPPQRVCVLASEVATVRELTENDWIWTKHATEAHYARQVRELEESPMEMSAKAQRRLADFLEGDHE